MHKLFKIAVTTDDDNQYRLTPDANSREYGAKEFAFKATDNMLLRFLRRCKVSDPTVQPRSFRALTYAEIIKFLQTGSGELFIYAHFYPKSHDELERILR